MKKAYSEAIVEVLDILQHTNKEDVDKIPKSFLEFLEKNKSESYSVKLDHSQSIGEMNLKEETHALLGLIYLKYWANDEEKKELYSKINRIKKNIDSMYEKVGAEDIFKNNKN